MKYHWNDLRRPAVLFVGIGLALLMAECLAAEAAAAGKLPPGAAALGYTKCVINERPSVADIAPGPTGHGKWFMGLWYHTYVTLKSFEMVDGVLAIHPRGVLVSAPHDFANTGCLPTLAGKDGFYAEFDVRLSDDDPDHWPAVWLMPVEHNGKQGDHYAGDPEGYVRYMELDVDEGSFGPGHDGHRPQLGRRFPPPGAAPPESQQFPPHPAGPHPDAHLRRELRSGAKHGYLVAGRREADQRHVALRPAHCRPAALLPDHERQLPEEEEPGLSDVRQRRAGVRPAQLFAARRTVGRVKRTTG